MMNASVQQPNLAVLLNTTTLATSLAFPTATTYTSEPPGGYTIHIEPSGTTTTLINQPVVFQNATSYTMIATEAAFASPALTPILLTDDNTPPTSGQMKLRVVNASPDLGNVDVYVVAPNAGIQNATPAFTNVAFKTAAGYNTLAPGNYQLVFTATGQKNVLLNSGTVRFAAGQIRTVVALDSSGGYTTATLNDLN
ncbi:MAG TPA: DUF4397 domain-containing protein [Terriglobales bacterium]|nr:DUF4397 domain-containing protein [Terriglobales bacterium]